MTDTQVFDERLNSSRRKLFYKIVEAGIVPNSPAGFTAIWGPDFREQEEADEELLAEAKQYAPIEFGVACGLSEYGGEVYLPTDTDGDLVFGPMETNLLPSGGDVRLFISPHVGRDDAVRAIRKIAARVEERWSSGTARELLSEPVL